MKPAFVDYNPFTGQIQSIGFSPTNGVQVPFDIAKKLVDSSTNLTDYIIDRNNNLRYKNDTIEFINSYEEKLTKLSSYNNQPILITYFINLNKVKIELVGWFKSYISKFNCSFDKNEYSIILYDFDMNVIQNIKISLFDLCERDIIIDISNNDSFIMADNFIFGLKIDHKKFVQPIDYKSIKISNFDYLGDVYQQNTILKIEKKKKFTIVTLSLLQEKLMVDLEEFDSLLFFLTDIQNPYIIYEEVKLDLVKNIYRYTFTTKLKKFGIIGPRILNGISY